MPPLPSVIVPRLVVVLVVSVVVGVVVLEVVAVVVLEVVVVGVVVELVEVDGVVVVEIGGLVVELLVVSSPPLSAETTASATPSPITAAIRTTISAFIPPLIPKRGGSCP